MTASRINVSKPVKDLWLIRLDGTEIARFRDGDDVQVEALLLAAQHLASHYESKTIDFTMGPDDMETIKRVGIKKPKLIGLN